MSIRIDGTNTAANPGITGADADTGLQFGTDEIQLVTGGTNRATVESNGNFTIEDGNLVVAAGHGIDFSADANAAGMTSELLDDYEVGTWTPVISSGANIISYSGGTQSFTYTKIGNIVTLVFSLNNASTSGTTGGNVSIQGLPFLPMERTTGSSVMFYSSGFRLDTFPAYSEYNNALNRIVFLHKSSATASYQNANVSSVGSASYFFFTHTYRTTQ